jgi:uncharacterized membrane protein YoaK (UPF0700 family)
VNARFNAALSTFGLLGGTLAESVRHYLHKNRNVFESSVLAHVLPFVAGAVNASGFFIIGTYTSHVTGSVARVGDDLAQGNVKGAFSAAFLVLSFYLGALLAASLAERARVRNKSPYSGTLEVETLTLIAITFLGITEPKSVPWLNTVTTASLCLAMGMQNALVTNLSGAVVRTTHLTGIVTDMGIETVRAFRWMLHLSRDPKSPGLLRSLVRYRSFPELKMLRLHTAIFVSFVLGAVIGPYLYLRHSYASMLLPIAMMLLLIAFDRLVGFRSKQELASNAHPPI